MASTSAARKVSGTRRRTAPRTAKKRILIEFPAAALRRAEEAARAEGVSRSEFIRNAVERSLEMMDASELERELAEACIANNARNLELLEEFKHVDRETWEKLP
jgi:metal-responsive CopG/Arc/MetJ family transcriptional regulator